MAEKRAVNSANKEMRDKEVGGLELDEATLMGEGGSFQAAYVPLDPTFPPACAPHLHHYLISLHHLLRADMEVGI